MTHTGNDAHDIEPGFADLDAVSYRGGSVQEPERTRISWQTGYLSDWELRLNDRRYKAHKTLLARASEFFAASLHSAYEATFTDLTELLPVAVHPVFELVLEEIYEGRSEADDTHVLLLFAAADILGMSDLFHKTLARIKACIKTRALSFLQDAAQLPVSQHLKAIVNAARKCIAQDFSQFCQPAGGGALNLPEEDIIAILETNDLASREDEIFDFIMAYVESRGTDDLRLWLQCRLAFLSQDRILIFNRYLAKQTTSYGNKASKILLLFNDALTYRSFFDCSTPPRDLIEAFEAQYPEEWHLPRRTPFIPLAIDEELDFVVHLPGHPSKLYTKGASLRSRPKVMGNTTVSILVFPCGTTGARKNMVSFFVEVVPADLEKMHEAWNIKRRFSISVRAWQASDAAAIKRLHDRCEESPKELLGNEDVRADGVRWRETFTFSRDSSDRGWHNIPHQSLRDCCDADGFLWLRAAVWQLQA